MTRHITFFALMAVSVMGLFVGGCVPSGTRELRNGDMAQLVWTDPQTGCQYFLGYMNKPSAPVLGADGKPICRGAGQ